MIKIPIKNRLIADSQELADEFDSIKIYEKLKCKNNWIGILGELVFKEWLDENKIQHQHICFLKQNYNEPDFIINNKSIDIKTTYDTQLWIQKPKHDIYILARVNDDLENLYLIGYITRQEIEERIKRNKISIFNREGRKDFVIKVNELEPIGLLYGELMSNGFTKKV